MSSQVKSGSARSRYLPFAVFMAFIGLDECIRFAVGLGLFTLDETLLLYLYPLKALVVAALLFHYRKAYTELSLRDLSVFPTTLASVAIGLLVFVLWITMDWTFGTALPGNGFNLTLFADPPIRITMALFRVAGAVLVVPLMEELFWRSFLIRYIMHKDFQRVPIGAFSWPSFLITIFLFGFEHSYILAGIMAGIIYNLLLYRTRSLAQCVLAHAVTNLALAIYVLSTGKWQFW